MNTTEKKYPQQWCNSKLLVKLPHPRNLNTPKYVKAQSLILEILLRLAGSLLITLYMKFLIDCEYIVIFYFDTLFHVNRND